jgi:hypothetical protein
LHGAASSDGLLMIKQPECVSALGAIPINRVLRRELTGYEKTLRYPGECRSDGISGISRFFDTRLNPETGDQIV